MQIISGYSDNHQIRLLQKLRLYHLSRPAIKQWRLSRHGKKFILDAVDKWLLEKINPVKLTAVDCAGWYFNDYGVDTQCIESDSISKIYYPDCHIEYDVLTHRPTYVGTNIVLFKYPWFLRYCKFDSFINFLNIWAKSEIVLNFNPVLIQHNHLKHNLIDLVLKNSNLNITQINRSLWKITI